MADALGLSEEERTALLAAVPKRGEEVASPAAEERASPGSSTPVVSALPHPATPLVGRERELGEVKGLLARQDVRLVTLTGIGGVGKTRLAVEAAREGAPLFPDGATFVSLAPLADPGLVTPTIAQSLGLREAEGQSPREALQAYLREKRLLMVLDNLEHLTEEAAPEVAELIESGSGPFVLVTSRAPLRIRGEREYPVPPLALPASTRSPSEEEILASPSGMLFAERARAALPTFEITGENATAVASICWRLAGLPLALELAAAKVRFLDPATLLSRLDGALSSAWARDLPERQRTMRATLDWSHGLLSEPERSLFRRLSVFAGGFTLEAAEAVGAAGGAETEDVLGLLGRLVEQSLVAAGAPSSANEGTRYGMLEPVRQYAHARLEGGEEEQVRGQHAGYYELLTLRAEGALRGAGQVEWMRRLGREHDNLRAAMGWLLDRGEAERAVGIGWNVWWF